MYLHILDSGAFERVKVGVHGIALGLAAVMCLYNAAAWLQRRQRHLAVNTLVYGGAIILERQHVAHHWRALRRPGAVVSTKARAHAPRSDERRAA